jgi:hypothetical protein
MHNDAIQSAVVIGSHPVCQLVHGMYGSVWISSHPVWELVHGMYGSAAAHCDRSMIHVMHPHSTMTTQKQRNLRGKMPCMPMLVQAAHACWHAVSARPVSFLCMHACMCQAVVAHQGYSVHSLARCSRIIVAAEVGDLNGCWALRGVCCCWRHDSCAQNNPTKGSEKPWFEGSVQRHC